MLIPATPDTKVIVPLNYCMYCGTAVGELTDEHVIPRGVNGHILVPRSTCKEHKDLTSSIEGEIQAADKKGMFAVTRLILGMRSYKKKKDRPKTVKLTFIGFDGRKFKKDVPIERAGAVHVMPVFLSPRYARDSLPLLNSNKMEVYALAENAVGADLKELVLRYGAAGIAGRVSIPMGAFLRYLCKIAYGFHVGELGAFDREDSPALALLLGERDDFANWIGCLPLEGEIPGDDWHRVEVKPLELGDGIGEVIHLSFFNGLAPCTYTIVSRLPGYQELVG